MESSYSAKYLAEKLSMLPAGNGTERIEKTLFNARISLNPHQIQAALFAFSSPISKGVMLCDEVGLGKTIEAGIVISQYWCERKRNILIIAPASLTQQWKSELQEKFNLPTIIIDRKYYNYQKKHGIINPFDKNDNVIIISINFASLMADEIKASKIDLVVIDEAHKLRNVYNPKNIMSNRIKNGIQDFKKLLLTATPLQNNLMELYGLSTLVDDSIFGDINYFKDRYIKNYYLNKNELRERLSYFINRTLRKDVQKYVKYSKRMTETFTFVPSVNEDLLYNAITELLQSSPSFGMKSQHNGLISILLRKLLSSSTVAVINTLEAIKRRLEQIILGESDCVDLDFLFEQDEYEEYLEDVSIEDDIEKIEVELSQIDKCLSIAYQIKDDKKAFRLLDSIEFLFSQKSNDRAKKILIFTESRKTQDYLYEFLQRHGYNKVVLYNGGNTDNKIAEIYENWINKPENLFANKNSKATNIRTAILEYFRDEADIMIATEAGSEGLNIQFCSMMINYDLPWNPQRVEQRIGRCHRYGQKNDVLVINFLNEHNYIDARIYELLGTKFKLFDDVFGASDEILGKLDSEMNFEREIFNIYLSCRTSEEIDIAFNELQQRYKEDISLEMKKTRALLIDNFDEDITNIFDEILEDTTIKLKEIETMFLRICSYAFKNSIVLSNDGFYLNNSKFGLLPGRYIIASNDKNKINLRMDDVHGNDIIKYCLDSELDGSVKFDITNYPYKINEISKLKGKKGIMSLSKIVIDSFEREEYLLLTGMDQEGKFIDKETCEKMFRLSSYNINALKVNNNIIFENRKNLEAQRDAVIHESMNKNSQILQNEIKRIDDWANDKISGIQLKVELLREQRKELQKTADLSVNASEKVQLELEITKISKKIRNLWLELADNEEEVEKQRKAIIDKLKAENMKKVTEEILFEVSFEVV